MGYCPYECIRCKDIKDNGWWNYKKSSQYSDLVNLSDVIKFFNIEYDLKTLQYPDYCSTPITQALCKHCFRVYRYEKEKSLGICLKMYSKKKVNGKWVKMNYAKIK